MELISALVVDEHAVVRRGLRSFLKSEGAIKVVGEAANGSKATEKVQQLLPEVVLKDVFMPGMDGIEATRTISSSSPYQPRAGVRQLWPGG